MCERYLNEALQNTAALVGVVLDPESFGIRTWEREAPWILNDAPYTIEAAIRRTLDQQRDEERRHESDGASGLNARSADGRTSNRPSGCQFIEIHERKPDMVVIMGSNYFLCLVYCVA